MAEEADTKGNSFQWKWCSSISLAIKKRHQQVLSRPPPVTALGGAFLNVDGLWLLELPRLARRWLWAAGTKLSKGASDLDCTMSIEKFLR